MHMHPDSRTQKISFWISTKQNYSKNNDKFEEEHQSGFIYIPLKETNIFSSWDLQTVKYLFCYSTPENPSMIIKRLIKKCGPSEDGVAFELCVCVCDEGPEFLVLP